MRYTVALAPPGAGVPFQERWAGKYLLLPFYCRRWDWSGAVALFDREGRALLARSSGVADERLERRVLVPRLTGLEDSSRHWSYAMALEHLTIIGRATENIVLRLVEGRRPEGVVRTADLKPAGRAGVAAAIDAYSDFLAGFRERVLGLFPAERSAVFALRPQRPRGLDAGHQFAHPWFGRLDAFEWVCFLPMHQRIHARQVERILAASAGAA